jgi:hypothetical protein
MMLKEYAAQLRAMGAGYVPQSVGRHVPVEFSLLIQNADYSTASGAVWDGDVRLLPDASGAVVGAFTITAVVQGDDTLVTITMAAPALIEGFPPARSTGEAAQLFYDIHLTPSGGTKQVFIGGDFNVVAGVVQDFTGFEDPPVAEISDFIRTLLDDIDAAAARATLGAGSGGGDLISTNNLSDLANTGTALTNLGVSTFAKTLLDDADANAVRATIGLGTGVSFPGSPTTGDRFYRTDRNVDYFYDGTRWLSKYEYSLPVFRNPANPSSTADYSVVIVNPYFGLFDIYVTSCSLGYYIVNGTTGSNYYTVQLTRRLGATQTNVGSALSTQSLTASLWDAVSTAPLSVIPSTDAILDIGFTKTGTVSQYLAFTIRYRLVG